MFTQLPILTSLAGLTSCHQAGTATMHAMCNRTGKKADAFPVDLQTRCLGSQPGKVRIGRRQEARRDWPGRNRRPEIALCLQAFCQVGKAGAQSLAATSTHLQWQPGCSGEQPVSRGLIQRVCAAERRCPCSKLSLVRRQSCYEAGHCAGT